MVLLQKLRKEQGLSVRELEERTGVGRITINNLENIKYKTSNERLEKLAKYFNIDEPLELIANVEAEVIKNKSCLNQRCPLNKNCLCQSPIVVENISFCQCENEVSEPVKEFRYNLTNTLFV